MLFFFYGENSFFSQQSIADLKSEFLKKNPAAIVSVFDFSDSLHLDKLKESLFQNGLFSQSHFILIKRPFGLTLRQQEDLLGLLKNPSLAKDKNIYVVIHENVLPKNKSTLLSFLKKSSLCKKFDILKGYALNKWVLLFFAKLSPRGKMSASAASALISLAGDDLWNLQQEIKKLALIDKLEITEKDVFNYCSFKNLSFSIFEFLDAFAKKNKPLALYLFHQKIFSGFSEYQINLLILKQLRNMLLVSRLLSKGITNAQELSEITKLHPFVIKKMLYSASIYDFNNLKKAYFLFQRLDKKIKSSSLEKILLFDAALVSY